MVSCEEIVPFLGYLGYLGYLGIVDSTKLNPFDLTISKAAHILGDSCRCVGVVSIPQTYHSVAVYITHPHEVTPAAQRSGFVNALRYDRHHRGKANSRPGGRICSVQEVP